MGRIVYVCKNGKWEVGKKEGPFPIVEREFSCKEHGDFAVSKHADEFDGPEPCPKCGEMSEAVFKHPNIDNTMYKRDPSSKDYWKNNMSTSEQAKVYTGEREPY